jgi:hypothetical protein
MEINFIIVYHKLGSAIVERCLKNYDNLLQALI